MFEYRFADRAALQLLWLIPLFLFLLWWLRRRTKELIQAHFGEKTSPFLLRSVSFRRRKWKVFLQALTLLFFILALARPQSGEGRQKAKVEGLELMLVVDVSNSMLAEDVRPSRLELAKKELIRFVESLGGDKIGIVAFAGSAILLSPMTNDKSAIKMFLESLTPESVSTQGTDFKRALDEAYRALHRGGLDADENQSITRVIVIASDGEENEKGGLEAARKIASDGIRIFTLGFGTEEGGQIPVRDGKGDLVGYKRDKSGELVVTKYTGEALKALAEAGEGTYHHGAFGNDAIRNLKADIDRLQRTQMESVDISNYVEHYQIFLFAGLMLALLELVLGERRREGRIWRGRFEVALD